MKLLILFIFLIIKIYLILWFCGIEKNMQSKNKNPLCPKCFPVLGSHNSSFCVYTAHELFVGFVRPFSLAVLFLSLCCGIWDRFKFWFHE